MMAKDECPIDIDWTPTADPYPRTSFTKFSVVPTHIANLNTTKSDRYNYAIAKIRSEGKLVKKRSFNQSRTSSNPHSIEHIRYEGVNYLIERSLSHGVETLYKA